MTPDDLAVVLTGVGIIVALAVVVLISALISRDRPRR